MIAAAINRAVRPIPTWPIYVGSALWLAWLFYTALTGTIGPDPVNLLERAYGKAALWLLVAGLCVTPLRRFGNVSLLRFRRALGLSAFAFVIAHFFVWALLDVGTMARVVADLTKRPYIIIGFVALLALLPLAVTSNNKSIRKLGAGWRKLHRLVYLIVLLAVVHYLMQMKVVTVEGWTWLAVIVVLLAVRLPFIDRMLRRIKG